MIDIKLKLEIALIKELGMCSIIRKSHIIKNFSVPIEIWIFRGKIIRLSDNI